MKKVLDRADHLTTLSTDRQPRHLAVFTNQLDDSLRAIRQRSFPSRVHLFLKPLHLHGLLNVLRSMTEDTRVPAEA